MHVRDPPVDTEAITGPDAWVFVQGSLEECLEIFCGGVLEESFGGFIDIAAETDRKR